MSRLKLTRPALAPGSRLSIRVTLLGSFLLVFCGMLVLVCCAVWGVNETRGGLQELRARELTLVQAITAANVGVREWCRPIAEHVLEAADGRMARCEQEMAASAATARVQLAHLERLSGLPGDGRATVARVRAELDGAEPIHAEVLRLSKAGRKTEAAALYCQQLRPVLARLEEQMQALRQVRQAQLEAGVVRAEERMILAAWRSGVLALATTGCAGVLLWVAARRITRGMAEVMNAAAAVVREVLQRELPPVPATDEVTCLKDTLGALRNALELSLAERAAVQAHLRELEQNLARTARTTLLGEMSAELAHELTQPLAAIAGYTEAALSRVRALPDFGGPICRTLEKAAAQTRRAGAIIQTVRGLARRPAAARESVELETVVREALEFLEHELEQRSAQVELALAPAPLCVWGSRTELEQVVVNLVRNGLEAMAGRPAVRLRIATRKVSDVAMELAVRDWGTGISPAIGDAVFTPFFTTKADGLGLGLAVSRTLVEAHGGRISAQDNREGGATFTVSLPVYRGAQDGDRA